MLGSSIVLFRDSMQKQKKKQKKNLESLVLVLTIYSF